MNEQNFVDVDVSMSLGKDPNRVGRGLSIRRRLDFPEVPHDQHCLALFVLANATQVAATAREREQVQRVVVVAEDGKALAGLKVPQADKTELSRLTRGHNRVRGVHGQA